MIPRTRDRMQSPQWQNLFRQAPLTPAELLRRLDLPQSLAGPVGEPQRQFPLRVPPAFLARIRPGDPDDPLLRQILPLALEAGATPGFSRDPLGEQQATRQPGLLHKYHGRILLTLTGACAIHCRYCFRRHFPYAESNPTQGAWHKVLDYIRADASIREVIFSGGDPLSLNDDRLAQMATDLAAIPHLRRLRVHSRLPVVLPERITDTLLDWLTATPLKPVLIVHVNHAQEIGPEAAMALQELHQAGIHLLNQSVLLRGVNDAVDVLEQLSESLFTHDVLPYYLHQLDPVQGAAHFQVPDADARAILQTLRERLSGYLVPALVREQAGAPYKLPLL